MNAGGAEVVLRREHFLEQILRDRLAGLVVAREQIEGLAFPTEVLHDLRGQLDEVPRHVGACQRFHRHLAEQVVEQVAELVEDRLHLAVSEQRRLAVDRRRHVADDQPEVRLAECSPVWQRVHPRATALRLARMPVGIERSEMGAVFESWIS